MSLEFCQEICCFLFLLGPCPGVSSTSHVGAQARQVAFAERGFSSQSDAIRTLARQCYFVNGTLLSSGRENPFSVCRQFTKPGESAHCGSLRHFHGGHLASFKTSGFEDEFDPLETRPCASLSFP